MFVDKQIELRRLTNTLFVMFGCPGTQDQRSHSCVQAYHDTARQAYPITFLSLAASTLGTAARYRVPLTPQA